MMKKTMVLCAVMLISMLAWAQTNIRKSKYVSNENWEIINSNPEYARAIIAVQDSLMAGLEISAQHLQNLMPRTYNEFRIFFAMEDYAYVKNDSVFFYSEKAIYYVAGNYAKADTLDMIGCYLKMFEWSDGWVGELLYTEAVEIERRNPEKFKRIASTAGWYEKWKAYRDAYIEWESQQKNKND
ncbi:MAG: hypothetical protein IKS33_01590 [Bacteroidales bacterium]|nr:hypothetical protein [Bacteroidales bacterium]